MVFLRSILTLLAGTVLVVTSTPLNMLPGASKLKDVIFKVLYQSFKGASFCLKNVDSIEAQVVVGTAYHFHVSGCYNG
ncbi:hypothetical protein L914_12998 [Phytophthora nicotianae]|uniref:Cystatin domain-containing protein n=1 Tax=Phytophthora nicotianae TaxID=4792 RepID=W2N0J9_PHYNI|nr:hypothetical protein L914_12998 [Phytophthora nicotianae]